MCHTFPNYFLLSHLTYAYFLKISFTAISNHLHTAPAKKKKNSTVHPKIFHEETGEGGRGLRRRSRALSTILGICCRVYVKQLRVSYIHICVYIWMCVYISEWHYINTYMSGWSWGLVAAICCSNLLQQFVAENKRGNCGSVVYIYVYVSECIRIYRNISELSWRYLCTYVIYTDRSEWYWRFVIEYTKRQNVVEYTIQKSNML